LTPTSRAVGLALIVASVKEKDNAYKWMCTLFTQRSRLQHALGAYLDARSKAKECKSGSAEAFTADSEAVEKLELVASLSAPLPESNITGAGGSGGKSPSTPDLESILKKVHAAKDKHIFRILSTICVSTHSPSARIRAFDELPKRTKSLGSAAQSWVKTLARRCAMGAFINAESIEHCTILAQECFEGEDCEASAGFLECVKLGTSIFPSLGSTTEGFKNLVEFFDHCRTAELTSTQKKEMKQYGLVTSLSEILARSGNAKSAVSASHPSSSGKKKKKDEFELDSEHDEEKSSYHTLREQLLRLCTRDGTPEQARNSVFTIASMIQPSSQQSTPGAVSIASAATLASRVRKEKKEFEPLLKALVNPSRLSIPDDTTTPKMRGRIVSILSAIAAIAECAPYVFNSPGQRSKLGWGQRAVKFCLDSVLLGKNTRVNASMTQDVESSDDSDGDDEDSSPTQKGKSPRNAKRAKRGKSNKVSVHCQMLCGAIEVIVSHIRSTIVNGQRTSEDSGAPKLDAISSDHLQEVFNTLVKILEDGGVPPSSVNGQFCKTSKDKAELRCSASVNLLRLCDANLRLEATYLTPKMWHVLSTALLDQEKSVRSSVMEELAGMYTSAGKYRAHGAAQLAPSLRFVSLVTLCADGDHGSAGAHSAANAGAANVGQRLSNRTKSSASACIHNLRTTCQTAKAQCRAEGRSSEKNFESQWKRRLMPEYCVPYALHLLAFREETASAAGTLPGENENEDEQVVEDEGVADDVGLLHSQEASQKMLKKRLKWLFDPLIQSLGAGADNISFLLRMVELIGKHPPINVLKKSSQPGEMSSLNLSLDDGEADEGLNDVDEKEAAARMKIICQFSREVLLSHVKNDVNLTVYPGSIQIPGDLFLPRNSVTPVKSQAYESEEEAAKKGAKRKPKQSISHYVKKRKKRGGEDDPADEDESEDDKSSKSELNLSGDTYEHSPGKSVDQQNDDPNLSGGSGDTPSAAMSPLCSDTKKIEQGFGDVSPIAKSDSPAVVDAPATRGRRKVPPKSNASDGKKKRSTREKSPKPMTSKISENGKRKKRKSSEIEDFEAKPSLASTDGSMGSSASGKSRRRGTTLTTSKNPKTTPKRSSTGKKSKSTPVSVPVKTVMVNVTNSATRSSPRPAAVSSSQKRRSTKRKGSKKEATEEKDFDFSGGFSDNFIEPSVESKVKAKAKAPAGRLRKKSGEKKVTPARKARTPAKAKLSANASAGKAKKSPAGKVARKASTGNVKATGEKGNTPIASKPAGKTPRRGKAVSNAKASPSTTSEASSRASPVRRGARRSPRATSRA